jgi:gamma-glutamylcyclotransferase (GGCT)/AIG2-like uncharacterized protein YtfP
MKCHLFAYGTLLSGALEPQITQLLQRHCRLGPHARIRGRLLDLGDYPGAVKTEAADEWIYGRLIELITPARCWPLLDSYEGYSPEHPERSLYLRERVQTQLLPERTALSCWVYWLCRPPRGALGIPSGEWQRHLAGG